jgi:glycosyltransferase involved in cell wall biosynthesis
MRILINALAVTNASGRHVLLGHLSRFAAWTRGEHDYVVIHHAANRDLCRDLGENVRWRECPSGTASWFTRSVWEQTGLGRVAREERVDLVFAPTGTITPGLAVPQVSYALNPWCLVDNVAKSPVEQVKAILQRRAYRHAVKDARYMLYLSEYMRQAFRKNAGCDARDSRVIYSGVDEETFASAERHRNLPKQQDLIVAISVMAPHKNIETLVKALALLRDRYQYTARLALVGSWPHPGYQEKIRELVKELCLDEHVTFTGHVSKEELHRYYAEGKVFCLMSTCESFGIPAVEAQAFGTPVVSSNCCAIPEICGKGGVYPEQDDIDTVAEQLMRLLSNDNDWETLSRLARENADRFHWDDCSQPFVEVFREIQRELPQR